MEFATIRITDPIAWWQRIKWIQLNCSEYQDQTNWAAWQIGLEDIVILVPKRDAVEYYLRWT